jgi:transposase InsO family protein
MAHPNARLTPRGRRLLAERIRSGWTITTAAQAAGISRRTGSKWWHRGQLGILTDRSSAVHQQARRHNGELIAQLCARRREWRVGPHRLAWEAGLARSSVYAILRREGLGRLDRLDPRPPVVRYERERRASSSTSTRRCSAGSRRAAVTGSGASRSTATAGSAGTGFTSRSTTTLASPTPRSWPTSIRPRPRVSWNEPGASMPATASRSNGPDRQRRLLSESALAATCDELGIGHRWTRPYRPQTNGKAERLVRTLLAEWAYAEPSTEPEARVAGLDRFLDFYNRRRPHWSLAGQPPISRTPVNNLGGKNT